MIRSPHPAASQRCTLLLTEDEPLYDEVRECVERMSEDADSASEGMVSDDERTADEDVDCPPSLLLFATPRSWEYALLSGSVVQIKGKVFFKLPLAVQQRHRQRTSYIVRV